MCRGDRKPVDLVLEDKSFVGLSSGEEEEGVSA